MLVRNMAALSRELTIDVLAFSSGRHALRPGEQACCGHPPLDANRVCTDCLQFIGDYLRINVFQIDETLARHFVRNERPQETERSDRGPRPPAIVPGNSQHAGRMIAADALWRRAAVGESSVMVTLGGWLGYTAVMATASPWRYYRRTCSPSVNQTSFDYHLCG